MLVHSIRAITHKTRNKKSDRQLGMVLAFIAGAINAGGFLAVGYYTSHTTGIVSSIADYLVLKQYQAAGLAVLLLASFIAGSAVASVIINLARARNYQSEFAAALMLEAILLLIFGVFASHFLAVFPTAVAFTIALLCFIMGLQNATITKISNAEIRTTHVTGLSTDIGIGIGRYLYKRCSQNPNVHFNGERFLLYVGLLVAFLMGGVFGALAFSQLGFVTTVPLALLLAILASVPIMDDWKPRPR